MKFSIQLSLFLRSFFLQAGWNYMKYQNLGLTFTMLPFLKNEYKNDKDALPSVLQRYLENFNTHPVMASFCSSEGLITSLWNIASGTGSLSISAV